MNFSLFFALCVRECVGAIQRVSHGMNNILVCQVAVCACSSELTSHPYRNRFDVTLNEWIEARGLQLKFFAFAENTSKMTKNMLK